MVNKNDIEERIKDWENRILKLYTEINEWLQGTDFTSNKGNKIEMYEELMSRFGIEKKYLDTLDIFKSNKCVLTIKPKGLWVIGCNGRIDLISKRSNYILVDNADPFKESNWILYENSKEKSAAFTKEVFFYILKEKLF